MLGVLLVFAIGTQVEKLGSALGPELPIISMTAVGFLIISGLSFYFAGRGVGDAKIGTPIDESVGERLEVGKVYKVVQPGDERLKSYIFLQHGSMDPLYVHADTLPSVPECVILTTYEKRKRFEPVACSAER